MERSRHGDYAQSFPPEGDSLDHGQRVDRGGTAGAGSGWTEVGPRERTRSRGKKGSHLAIRTGALTDISHHPSPTTHTSQTWLDPRVPRKSGDSLFETGECVLGVSFSHSPKA